MSSFFLFVGVLVGISLIALVAFRIGERFGQKPDEQADCYREELARVLALYQAEKVESNQWFKKFCDMEKRAANFEARLDGASKVNANLLLEIEQLKGGR